MGKVQSVCIVTELKEVTYIYDILEMGVGFYHLLGKIMDITCFVETSQ